MQSLHGKKEVKLASVDSVQGVCSVGTFTGSKKTEKLMGHFCRKIKVFYVTYILEKCSVHCITD